MMTSCEIRAASSTNGAGFSASFVSFSLLIMIPPLLHTHLLAAPEQAAHYHIIGL
jgi:hypothetical protein